MPDEEIALWRRYARSRSVADRNALVERYASFCRNVCGHVIRRTSCSYDDFDELLSAAHFGLLSAIERYDVDRGVHPKTFLMWRIRGAVLDYLREERDTLTRHRRRLQNEINAWEQTLDHVPTTEEIRERFPSYRPPLRIASLDATVPGCRRDVTIGDIIPDRHGVDVFASVGDCADLLRGMNNRQRLLLLLYYVEGLTMAEVAESLGVSESRVSQQLASLRERLRHNARAA